MRIISESSEQLTRIKERKDLIPDVIDRIFSIYKEDPNFFIDSNVYNIDEKIGILKNQLSKQNNLLEQAKKMEKDLLSKIKLLEDDSYGIKVRVLESLGSEI